MVGRRHRHPLRRLVPRQQGRAQSEVRPRPLPRQRHPSRVRTPLPQMRPRPLIQRERVIMRCRIHRFGRLPRPHAHHHPARPRRKLTRCLLIRVERPRAPGPAREVENDGRVLCQRRPIQPRLQRPFGATCHQLRHLRHIHEWRRKTQHVRDRPGRVDQARHIPRPLRRETGQIPRMHRLPLLEHRKHRRTRHIRGPPLRRGAATTGQQRDQREKSKTVHAGIPGRFTPKLPAPRRSNKGAFRLSAQDDASPARLGTRRSTRYSGRSFVSLNTRPRYSPMTPSVINCTPPRNNMITSRLG